MPALLNARWERFAQAVASGLAEPSAGFTQAAAYKAAGFNASGHSAEVCASRMLKTVEPVIARIRELHEENARHRPATVTSIAKRLDIASRIAEEDRVPSAMAAAEVAKAKLLGLQIDRVEQGKAGDFSTSESTKDIADKLIKVANPAIEHVLEHQRIAVAEELARHASILSAIAHDVQPMPQAMAIPKPRLAKSLKHQDITAQH